MALILLDKSAWARGGAGLADRGELCLCAITRLEILYSAQTPAEYETRKTGLDAYRDLRIDTSTIAAAEAGQAELARTGRHRVSLPDLVIAACAQQHGADILHVDRHFDLLAEIFGFRSLRL